MNIKWISHGKHFSLYSFSPKKWAKNRYMYLFHIQFYDCEVQRISFSWTTATWIHLLFLANTISLLWIRVILICVAVSLLNYSVRVENLHNLIVDFHDIGTVPRHLALPPTCEYVTFERVTNQRIQLNSKETGEERAAVCHSLLTGKGKLESAAAAVVTDGRADGFPMLSSRGRAEQEEVAGRKEKRDNPWLPAVSECNAIKWISNSVNGCSSTFFAKYEKLCYFPVSYTKIMQKRKRRGKIL